MSIHEHQRFQIWNPGQHPYRHNLAEFSYVSEALPGVTNVESALNWILAVLYPNAQDSVADVASLPAAGNTINDYRVVTDDGDGKAASYRWEQREGDASAKWYKIYDMDWGMSTILSNVLNQTNEVYVYKHGIDQRDSSGTIITGTYAGQHIYGGASANTNLTLEANAGDGVGAESGYVQTVNTFRPVSDNALDLGTSGEQFQTLYLGTSAIVDTLTVAPASITDSSGAISFGDENLSTTGTFTGLTGYFTSSLEVGPLAGSAIILSPGSITDETGSISFGNENLSTTGTLGSNTITITDSGNTLILSAGAATQSTITSSLGQISFVDENLVSTGTLDIGNITSTQVNADNVRLDGNTLSITDTDGNLTISANGSGVVDVTSAMTTIGQTVTGTVDITGQLDVDNLRLNGNTLSSTDTDGNIILDPNGSGLIELGAATYPETTSSWDLGKSGNVWNDLWIDGNIQDGSNAFLISELMALRNVMYRAADRLTGVQDGDCLFYDSASGTWLADHPDTEIAHSEISGLTTTDAGHTQFVMLAGRSGGQTIHGGTDASDNLTLESTANATKGQIILVNTIRPETTCAADDSTGVDIGDSTPYFIRHVYSHGQFFGLRLQNITTDPDTDPGSSANTIGRLVYHTTEKKAYVDTGSGYITLGVSKHIEDVAFNGSDTVKNVDVSANITDARNAQIQLCDNTNDYERIYCSLKATSASNVRITVETPLPAGNYRLIVME